MYDFDTFQKLLKNVGFLSKIIVATGFEWLPVKKGFDILPNMKTPFK